MGVQSAYGPSSGLDDGDVLGGSGDLVGRGISKPAIVISNYLMLWLLISPRKVPRSHLLSPLTL